MIDKAGEQARRQTGKLASKTGYDGGLANKWIGADDDGG